MSDASRITTIVDIAILVLAVLCILMYLLPIICIRRFHTTNNILTGNVCLTSIICCLYWITRDVILVFYPSVLIPSTFSYIFTSYFETMVNCLLVYSLTTVTKNRYLTILYPNKRFFKKKAWSYLSSGIEWLIAMILPIPFLVLCTQECTNDNKLPSWTKSYNLLVVVIVPSILNIIFNTLIFFSVRSSTQRVHALAMPGQTIEKSSHRNTRDIYLLKHMFFLFIVFIIGWTPVYILQWTNADQNTSSWLGQLFEMLPVISTLIIVLDLFFYNHDLRQYLKEKLLKFV